MRHGGRPTNVRRSPISSKNRGWFGGRPGKVRSRGRVGHRKPQPRSWTALAAALIAVVAVDQATKLLANQILPWRGDHVRVAPWLSLLRSHYLPVADILGSKALTLILVVLLNLFGFLVIWRGSWDQLHFVVAYGTWLGSWACGFIDRFGGQQELWVAVHLAHLDRFDLELPGIVATFSAAYLLLAYLVGALPRDRLLPDRR